MAFLKTWENPSDPKQSARVSSIHRRQTGRWPWTAEDTPRCKGGVFNRAAPDAPYPKLAEYTLTKPGRNQGRNRAETETLWRNQAEFRNLHPVV